MYDLPNYKMQYLRYLWKIDDDSAYAHDAKGDVVILEKVFLHLLKEYIEKNNVTEDQAIKKFIEVSNEPQLLRKITFGKHAGKTFEEINKIDHGYITWLADKALADKDADFIYTVNHYVKILK